MNAPMIGAVLPQKALQGSKTKTRKLLEGTEENNIFLTFLFYKKQIKLVARPEMNYSFAHVREIP